MIRRLKAIKAVLQQRFPESRLTPWTAAELAALKLRFPEVPTHLVNFFEVIGSGTIGPSRYRISELDSPDGIFDDETAAALDGIVLIGDDFAGGMDAYDTRSG